MKKLPLLFLSLISSYPIMAQLEKHRWENRVILLFAEGPKQESFKAQKDLLQKNKAALLDRDLVVYQVFEEDAFYQNKKESTPKLGSNLSKKYNAEGAKFKFILIGKDGGVKLRSNNLVKMQDLFALIDGMPMRRAEMRRRKNK